MDKSMFQIVHQETHGENVGLFIVIMFSIFLVAILHTRFSRKFRCLPPGPWPWPIVGNLLMLGKHPHLTLTRWAESYGPLMHLQLGSINTVVASSPTMAKEFLKTQDHVFQYRPSSFAFKIVHKNLSMGVISGPTLLHIRKICMNELFTFKRIQSFQPMRTKEIRETIKDIYKEANEGKVVDLTFKLSSISTNHMTQMLFRKRYCGIGSDDKKTQWFKETIDAVQYWFGAFIISDYIPYLRWVTKLQGVDSSLQALRNQISNFVTKIMDEHRTTPSTPNSNIEDVPKDFVDVLFTMPQEDGTGHLTDDTIQTRLLQSFDWSIPNVEQEPIDMSETFGLTLKKTKPLCVVAHPRLEAQFYD
ncbi:unnamed protein product [Sphagnum troendelagicum]|uniref:Cytochrome P450 n=1 Tax=Sphagnum troendelagicum TaxID=128251 RepID=A0ABP0UVV0_9BRYO